MDSQLAPSFLSRASTLAFLASLALAAPAAAQGEGTDPANPPPATDPAEPGAEPELEPEPPLADVPAPPPAPVAEPELEEDEEDAPTVVVTGQPGRGIGITVGDVFSFALRARVQLRNTTSWLNPAGDGDRNPANEIQPRTLRLWFTGSVFDPHVKYGIQLAFGANDFDPGNASPIFDAFVELTHLRDLNVKIGQFFVPFDRARTIRESSLQTVDRTNVVRELTLDRDVGVVLQSADLFGLDGLLAYNLGFFGGEGRNRFGGSPPGFLYTARVAVRPFGAFDDDAEGDLEHREAPRLQLGLAAAYDQNAIRQRGTTGSTYVLGTVDYLSLAADLVLKWRGIYFLGEVVYRDGAPGSRTGVDDDGNPFTEYARDGHGYLLQASYGPTRETDVWFRYNRLYARGDTDPTLVTLVDTAGQEIATGANYYVNGHNFKVQADYGYLFGADVGVGTHSVRVQLDATF